MLDDVVVVVKAESFDVDGFVERPGVRRVLLGQHLSDQPRAEAQVILPLLRGHSSGFQAASEVMLRVGLQRFPLGLLERPSGLASRPSVGGDGRGRAELVVGRGGGGVRFSLLALSRLFEGQRSDVKQKKKTKKNNRRWFFVPHLDEGGGAL